MAFPSWVADAAEVDRIARANDLCVFLRWEPILRTMFVESPAWIAVELDALLGDDAKWGTGWRVALREDQVGSPRPCSFYPESSGNLIHHAYHVLQMERVFSLRVSDYQTIVEFGGGYGSLCRLIHRLGFTGEYLIYDLPPFAALQRRYLDAVGIMGVKCAEGPGTVISQGEISPSLFIATWSLSETPIEVREAVTRGLCNFDNVLIAYQESFYGIDNVTYFRDLARRADTFIWRYEEITHLPGNYYLFGHRKA